MSSIRIITVAKNYNKYKTIHRLHRSCLCNLWMAFYALDLDLLTFRGRTRLLCFLFLPLLIRDTEFSRALQSGLVILLILGLLLRLAIHLGELCGLQQQVGLVRPGRFIVRIKLNGVLGIDQTLRYAPFRLIEFFLIA